MAIAGITSTLTTIAVALAIAGALATLLAAAWGAKYKTAADAEKANADAQAELAQAARAYADLMKDERDEIRAKLEEVTAALLESKETIARLEALPNLERVLRLMTQTYDKIETRQKERFEELRDVQNETLIEVKALRASAA
jgi:hypothetical protein